MELLNLKESRDLETVKKSSSFNINKSKQAGDKFERISKNLTFEDIMDKLSINTNISNPSNMERETYNKYNISSKDLYLDKNLEKKKNKNINHKESENVTIN